MNLFKINEQYTKKDIYEILNVPTNQRKGAWDTGYREYDNKIFIFANVGTPGRTGHDYNNFWDGEYFIWEAKTNSNIRQPLLKKIIENRDIVFLFTRTNDKFPYTFEGIPNVLEYKDSSPVIIKWEFNNEYEYRDEKNPNEVSSFIYEGSVSRVNVNKYERNPLARRICISHYGAICLICGFDFYKVYGELGKGFIHVHHVIPISKIKAGYILKPIEDLIPVCPNCHAMLHRKSPPLKISELKEKLYIKNN